LSSKPLLPLEPGVARHPGEAMDMPSKNPWWVGENSCQPAGSWV